MAAGCKCKAAIGCVDARAQVRRASYVSLYKWPESDAEFVKSVAMARRHQGGSGGGQESPGGASSYHHHYYNGSASMRNSGELQGAGYCSPRVVDSYSCRQMYLRSYTFSKKKESVPERTMACLGRVRERAAVFPFLIPHRSGGGAGPSSSDAAAVSRGEGCRNDDDDDVVVVGLRAGSSEASRNTSRRMRRRATTTTTKKKKKKKKKKKGSCAVVRRLHEASCGAVRAIFRRLLACTTSVDVADAPQPSR